jgi:pyrroline-5-carboxylate reductase
MSVRAERLGFIGAGQMAEAIARGLLEAKLFPAAALRASDPAEARRALFESLGVRAGADNLAVVRESEVIVIAVKPQNVDELLRQVGPALTRRQFLISICAGCPTALFESATPEPIRVVRAMPNLAMRVRMGATALCGGRHATPADLALAGEVFGAAGKTVVVEERLMDAVTAVSGSGPAYFYFLVEALIEAGKREGLPAEVAKELAIQTARGAAETMAREDAPPEELRRRVTSKGGTTEAAFRRIEELKVREGLLEAVAAAARRARELGRK